MQRINAFDAGFIALGAALNVSIGYLVSIFKLPLYLDSIGTILISTLCGWVYGVIVGIAGLFVLSMTVTPTVIAYAGTVVIIALLSSFFGRFGFLKNARATILGGITIGAFAAIASVPVTTFLYGGVTLAGSDAITTFFKASGMSLWESVLMGSLLTDSMDKLITAIICSALIKSIPPYMLERVSKKRI
jgi:energy-coupling factor transport system substrate-specific component